MPIINMVYKKKKGWKPWANTIAYYKFDWNLNDSSGNGHNWTWSAWTAQYATLSSWKKVAQLSWQLNRITTTFNWTPATVSLWVCKNSDLWGDPRPTWWKQILWQNSSDGGYPWYYFRLSPNPNEMYTIYQSGTNSITTSRDFNNVWMHLLATNNWWDTYFYINWEYQWKLTWNITKNTNLWMWCAPYDWSPRVFVWYIGDVILEDKARTAQEVVDYYNQTKANYWL